MPGVGFSDARRRVFRSLIVVGATEVIRYAWLLFLTGVLGRTLSAAEFGFVRLVPSIYLVAHVVLDLGAGALIAREAVLRPARERPLLEAALFVRGIGGAVLGVVVAAFAMSEPDGVRRFWLFVTALSLPALAPAVVGSAFRVRQDQLSPAIISLVTIALMIAVTFLGIGEGWSGASFAVIYVLREVVGCAALWIVGRARHGLRLRPRFAGPEAGVFFRAAIPQNIAVIFQVTSLNFGIFATRALLGEDQLGSYSAAWALVVPFLLLMGALAAPLLPVLAQATLDRAAFVRVFTPALAVAAGLGILGAGFLLAVGRDALTLVYDSPESVRFSAGPLDAGPTLMWLGFVFAAVSVGAVSTTALLSAHGERHLRALAIMALFLNAVVFSVSLRPLGRVAAVSGLLAAEVWTATAALVLVHRKVGPLNPLGLAKSAAAMALVVVAMLLLPATMRPLARVTLAVGLAGAGVGAMLVFGPGRALRRALREPLA